MASPAALPYHEPGIITILILSSFTILLNAVSYILDNILYCGLIGQIFIGIAFGTPGAKWLEEEVEHVIIQFGYLGLTLLVYEGGLSTSFPSLKANLVLSSVVALTGITLPIVLSFTLQSLVSATPLQAFAAGAALCSTSLGTTFTVLGTSGLTNTRLGTVLTSAAMMDDVVGLVMVQVISNLGGGSTFSAVTVVRPVFVSLGFGISCPVVCRFCLMPLTVWLNAFREESPTGRVQTLLTRCETAFAVHTLLLVAMITGSTFAGTSNLFAAYLTGAMVSWWDSEVPHPLEADSSGNVAPGQNSESQHKAATDATSGRVIYHRYYSKPVDTILKPLFFASIGFSIPVTRMFAGGVLWRGIIYTVLMMLGKLICGLWLVRFSVSIPRSIHPKRFNNALSSSTMHFWGKGDKESTTAPASSQSVELKQRRQRDECSRLDYLTTSPPAITPITSTEHISTVQNAATDEVVEPSLTNKKILSPNPKKPVSLYPASILGLAMVARGEIGFLISSLAESKGIFGEANGEIFLGATWAIVLCTIIGPIGVGLLARRLKRLEKQREADGGERDVLGVWGVGTG